MAVDYPHRVCMRHDRYVSSTRCAGLTTLPPALQRVSRGTRDCVFWRASSASLSFVRSMVPGRRARLPCEQSPEGYSRGGTAPLGHHGAYNIDTKVIVGCAPLAAQF